MAFLGPPRNDADQQSRKLVAMHDASRPITPFAYGTNMDRDHMRRTCPDARPVRTAWLRNFRFLINRQGWATIVPDPASSVWGVAWHLTPQCESALDEFEEVDSHVYEKALVDAIIGLTPAPAMVYFARDDTPGVPNPGYLENIILWSSRWNLPAAYMAELRRHLPGNGFP
jgi:gamma-glutamylcyclotransferase (GGCT)/AIG2-like uncharacterized protein YtfP